MGKDRFSITPPTDPVRDYEVANKKYVDDIIATTLALLLSLMPDIYFIISNANELILSNADENIIGL